MLAVPEATVSDSNDVSFQVGTFPPSWRETWGLSRIQAAGTRALPYTAQLRCSGKTSLVALTCSQHHAPRAGLLHAPSCRH